MESINASLLLERIIAKGGLYGKAAAFYHGDPIKTKQFIKECSEQCHNKSVLNYWGEDLVTDIKKFTVENEK